MTECIFPKRLERPKMFVPSSPVTEATEGGLKLLVGLMVIRIAGIWVSGIDKMFSLAEAAGCSGCCG